MEERKEGGSGEPEVDPVAADGAAPLTLAPRHEARLALVNICPFDTSFLGSFRFIRFRSFKSQQDSRKQPPPAHPSLSPLTSLNGLQRQKRNNVVTAIKASLIQQRFNISIL